MKRLTDRLGISETAHVHWCPACNDAHVIHTDPSGTHWEFDGNVEAPTFSPSVRLRWVQRVGMEGVDRVCHYFVTAGKIEFCGDCTHELAGQTVEMPPIPPSWFDH